MAVEVSMKVHRVSAFSYNNKGGNPAGVVVSDHMPSSDEMLRIAKEVGYSETAFLASCEGGWRVRYFAPEMEVPFCGHATIAAGFVLGELKGPGTYVFFLNDGSIDLHVERSESEASFVALNSPGTASMPAPADYVARILSVMGLSLSLLNPVFPIRFASAGAKHLIVVLKDKADLSALTYDFEALKAVMAEQELVTVNVLYMASPRRFHSRNPFPPGGVYEDPATGAAAAAFAGYLRDIEWLGDTDFEVIQGEDMGQPSRLLVSYQKEVGSSVRVSGEARYLSKC
jgi:PhzF family phenazine biosynthesis protein